MSGHHSVLPPRESDAAAAGLVPAVDRDDLAQVVAELRVPTRLGHQQAVDLVAHAATTLRAARFATKAATVRDLTAEALRCLDMAVGVLNDEAARFGGAR